MVLHRSNFEIPARFSFQPYVAEWRFVSVETVEWDEEPKLKKVFQKKEDNSEKTWVRVRIEVPDMSDPGNSLGFYIPGIGVHPSYTVLMNRTSIPPDVLQAHENYSNTPDISGRYFSVLICQKPEFKDGLWALKPGEVTKNAWIMRDEFLSLGADPDPESGWDWSARHFLNKWGLWGFGQVYVEDWDLAYLQALMEPLLSVRGERAYKIDKSGFVMVIPHLLKEQQERYRKALLPSNARPWLRSHPLNLDTADEFPFFRAHKSYCSDAIDTTITIDHLAERQFGICKRCHNVFQKETRHKKSYCSERCFNAAGVQRWRENQRNKTKKGAKRNAKRQD
jgi:hypothetical protein